MAWPPASLPTNRSNATPQTNTHPADHNALAAAINDTVAQVQYLDSAARRYGFTAQQGGQAVAAGQTVQLAWTSISDPAWGGGPVFTVPAGQGGIYAGCVECVGPTPPADSHADIVLVMSGVQYSSYIPEGKARAVTTAVRAMTPGEQVSVSVYNPVASSQFFSATLIIVRLAV